MDLSRGSNIDAAAGGGDISSIAHDDYSPSLAPSPREVPQGEQPAVEPDNQAPLTASVVGAPPGLEAPTAVPPGLEQNLTSVPEGDQRDDDAADIGNPHEPIPIEELFELDVPGDFDEIMNNLQHEQMARLQTSDEPDMEATPAASTDDTPMIPTVPIT